MSYTAKPEGNCIQFVCYGVKPVGISRLNNVMRRGLHAENYVIMKEVVQKFKGEPMPGYTGVSVISESDLTFHTYWENGALEVTINTCRGPDAGWMTLWSIVNDLMPEYVYVHSSRVPLIRSAVPSAMRSDFVMGASPTELFKSIETRITKCCETSRNDCSLECVVGNYVQPQPGSS